MSVYRSNPGKFAEPKEPESPKIERTWRVVSTIDSKADATRLVVLGIEGSDVIELCFGGSKMRMTKACFLAVADAVRGA